MFEKKFYKLYKKHKSLNINNPYEDIEEDENQQSMESDSEIRAFMQSIGQVFELSPKEEKCKTFSFFSTIEILKFLLKKFPTGL